MKVKSIIKYFNEYLYVLFMVLLVVIITGISGSIDQYNVNYNIPIGLSPNITSWSNSKTNDNSTDININVGEQIKFNIVADQIIDIWQWKKDGIIQNNNYDNFTTSWSTIGSKIITVNGSNNNGITNTITWNVNVLNQTILTACGILNKPNSVYVLGSDVSSNGTCFTIGANNITIDGQRKNVNYAITTSGYGVSDAGGYDNIDIRNFILNQQNAAVTNSHGIYLRNVINSIVDNTRINTKNNAEGIYLTSSSSNILSNITITTSSTGAYGIYLTSSNSNTFKGCDISTAGNGDGIYLTSSNSNTFTGCNVSTTGSNGDGIYLTSSNSNTFSGSTLLTSGTGANGIWINTNGNYNNFSNMNVLAMASGIRINSAGFNIIKDGSIISKSANDYFLQNNSGNNFINTNFTTRKIYFSDANSGFNYAIDKVMLNTNQIVTPTKSLTITRTLVNWNQTNISWKETVSATRTLKYGLSGLLPNTKYSVWNGAIINYNLTTDSSGNLPNFNLNLTTAQKFIKVVNS